MANEKDTNEDKPKPRRGRPPKKSTDNKNSNAGSNDNQKPEPPAKIPTARRGRPPKAAPAAKADNSEASVSKEAADKPQPRRRGRPPKSESPNVESGQDSKSSAAAKRPAARRGRPPAKKADDKTVEKEQSGSKVSSGGDTVTDKPKPRRGRPPKALSNKTTSSQTPSSQTPSDADAAKPSLSKAGGAGADSQKKDASSTEADKPKPRRRGRPPAKKAAYIDQTKQDQNKEQNKGQNKEQNQSRSKTAGSDESVDSNNTNDGSKDSGAAPRSGRGYRKPPNKPQEESSADSGKQEDKSSATGNERKVTAKPKPKSWMRTIDLTGGSRSEPNADDNDEIEETEDDSKFNKMEYLEGNKSRSSNSNSNRGNRGARPQVKKVQSDNQSDISNDSDGNSDVEQPKDNANNRKPVGRGQKSNQPESSKEDEAKEDENDGTTDAAPKKTITIIKKDDKVKEDEAKEKTHEDESVAEEEKGNSNNVEQDTKDSKQQQKKTSDNKPKGKKPPSKSQAKAKPATKQNDQKQTDSKETVNKQAGKKEEESKRDDRKHSESKQSNSKVSDDNKASDSKQDNSRASKQNPPNRNQLNKNKVSDNPKKEKKERAIYRYTPSVYSYEIQKVNEYQLMNESERKHPFIDGFLKRITQFMREKLYVDIDVKILIAVSGGVDSVVLTDVLAMLSQEYHFSFEIAHYNHELREGSDKDENFVRHLANSYRVGFHAGRGNVKKLADESGMSVEEAARHLRYGFLQKVVEKTGAQFVATAHNANDSAETLLMNLMRGSGLTGLSGIPPKREFGRDAIIIRPFLNVTRDEIEKYVSIRKLFWVEDITNRSLDFTRNKIRHTVIPDLAEKFNPKLVETLHRTTQILRGADTFLSKQIEEHAKLALDEYKEGSLLIKKGILNSYTDFVKGEVLQYLLTKHFDLTPLPSKQLDKISELPNTSIGSKAEVSKEILAINQRDTILISDFVERETNTEPVYIREEGEFLLGDYKYQVTYMDAKDIKLVPDSDIEYFDVEYMPQSLTLRYWADGDRISPLGMDGTTKVSDYLTNEKIEPGERPSIAVFFDGVEVIWICGMRVSDKYKISTKTKKVMRVERSEIVVEDKEN